MSDRPSLGAELADVGGALPAGLPPVGPQGPGPGPYAPPPRNPGLGGQPPGPPPWGGGPPPGSFGPTGPSPGPIPEPVGPTGPSLDPPVHPIAEQAELLFFGTLAPVEATLTWSGQVWDVQIHVLTVEEENKLAAYVARQPLEQKVMAEAMLRMAYSLRT